MSDDQGWGDVGYHDHPFLKTPNLDQMAESGMRLDRFYSAAPVCSPTRGSCLTGRHPYRYGIFNANVGHLPAEEVTLAETLKPAGYSTGHFGKWHLGTLTMTVKESNRGGEKGKEHYSPPWTNGFDVCFSTEEKTPTYDPMIQPENGNDHRWWNPVEKGAPHKDYNTHYWSGPDQMVTKNLEGDDSEIIMDRALLFIKNAVEQELPFFCVIWFHAPHWPVVAGKKYRDLYSDLDEFSQNHFGCISAMDAQVGRLRRTLRNLGISENTMLWFCSDNGPEGLVDPDAGKRQGKGSAGSLRGRKRDLFEGGIRVPGILEWPGKIEPGQVTEFPCSTSDYFPTIMDALNDSHEDRPNPIDGLSLLPMLTGKMKKRQSPIAFQSGKQIALIDNRYKIISINEGQSFMMFDLINDPGERNDIATDNPGLLNDMIKELKNWQQSCKRSLAGEAADPSE
jgi:arylsulfatase A-like enzyme